MQGTANRHVIGWSLELPFVYNSTVHADCKGIPQNTVLFVRRAFPFLPFFRALVGLVGWPARLRRRTCAACSKSNSLVFSTCSRGTCSRFGQPLSLVNTWQERNLTAERSCSVAGIY